MSEGLERLKEIGAQKICEDTHIPVEHVQAIIHESFDGFTRVQFLGFVSILEREYGEDLSALRLRGLESFDPYVNILKADSVFVSPKRKKSFTSLYIFLVLLVFGVVAYFKIYLPQEITEIQQNGNITMADLRKSSDTSPTLVENNNSLSDTNASVSDINSSSSQEEPLLEESSTESEIDEMQEEEIVPAKLTISARSKLWLGYIDVATNRHYDKSFIGDFELDASKSWLLVFGHRFADIELGDSIIEVNKESTLRFLYEDAKIEPLSLSEFKKLNKGRAW